MLPHQDAVALGIVALRPDADAGQSRTSLAWP